MSPLKEISRNKLKSKHKFKCELCQQEFESESVFKTHMQLHENKCNLCDQSFSSRWNLKRHKENIHGVKDDNTPQKDKVMGTPIQNIKKEPENESKENKVEKSETKSESTVTAYCDICNQGFKGRCGKQNMERHKLNLHPKTSPKPEAVVRKIDDHDDETDEEDDSVTVMESVSDLDIATDFYNRILLGLAVQEVVPKHKRFSESLDDDKELLRMKRLKMEDLEFK